MKSKRQTFFFSKSSKTKLRASPKTSRGFLCVCVQPQSDSDTKFSHLLRKGVKQYEAGFHAHPAKKKKIEKSACLFREAPLKEKFPNTTSAAWALQFMWLKLTINAIIFVEVWFRSSQTARDATKISKQRDLVWPIGASLRTHDRKCIPYS